MSTKAVRRIMLACLLGCIVFLGLTVLAKGNQTVQIVLFMPGIVFFVGYLITCFFWRCPGCNRTLPYRGPWLTLHYCPHCGEYIE